MQSVNAIEKQLYEQIKQVELIGELNITPELVERLYQLVQNQIQNSQAAATRQLERFYPASFVVFLVAQGIYNYRDGDYWTAITQDIGINSATANKWGQLFERLLKDWGKPRFPGLGGRRYVDHILVHGGIPDDCLPDFFEHLLQPAVLQSQYDQLDVDELIGEWLQSSAGLYAIPKPVQRFLTLGGAFARDFVSRCLEMARQQQEHDQLPNAVELGLPERVLTNYRHWYTEHETGLHTTKTQQRLIRPQILLDAYGGGVFLDLPSQNLPDANHGPHCHWSVICNGATTSYPVHSWRCASGWETGFERLPLPQPTDAWDIQFDDGRGMTRSWHVQGIPNGPILAFDPETDQLMTLRDKLPGREIWLLYPRKQQLQLPAERLREQAEQLSDRWREYRVERWNLTGLESITIGGQEIAIEPDLTTLRPHLDGGNAFYTGNTQEQIVLFANSLPNIIIPRLAQSDAQLEMRRWQITIREEGGQLCASKHLDQLADAIQIGDDHLQLSLERANVFTERFGTFIISMRGPLGRDIDFHVALIPQLQISGHERVRIPDQNGQYTGVELQIETAPHLNVLVQDTDIQYHHLGAGIHKLLIPGEHTRVAFQLTGHTNKVDIVLPLPRLEWDVKGVQAEDHRANRLIRQPLAWLIQGQAPTLQAWITPISTQTVALTGEVQVCYDENRELQVIRSHGHNKRPLLHFQLAEATDSIRNSTDPSARFELVIPQLAGHQKSVSLPVLHVSKHLEPSEIHCSGIYHDNTCLLLLRWRGGAKIRHRQLRLWSLWRPWEEPICLSIDDQAGREMRWQQPMSKIPPGHYRAEMTVRDPWESGQQLRPFQQGHHLLDISLGYPAEQVSYLRHTPTTLAGSLERLLATREELAFLARLQQLPTLQSDQDMIYFLGAYLTLCERPDIVENLQQPQWVPMTVFRQIVHRHMLQFLVALSHWSNRLDPQELERLEYGISFIAPELGILFFQGLRTHTIAEDELYRIIGEPDTNTQATLFALFKNNGISLYEANEIEIEETLSESANLSNIYEYIPEVLISDSLRQYLREIGQFPLLSAAQERELGRTIAIGTNAEQDITHTSDSISRHLLQQQIKKGKAARETLANANLRLVVSIAKKYSYRRMPLLDLIQEGNIGLLKAIEKFDVNRKYKFSTYATWWIRQAITRGIDDQERVIRLPVHLVEAINRLRRTQNRLSIELGRDPSIDELAEELDMPSKKIQRYLQHMEDATSLDITVGEDRDSTLGDFIAIDDFDFTEDISQQQLQEQIDLSLAKLTERERRVLELRFGIIDQQERTLEEVGKAFGVTRERIRQIEVKALRKLRHPHIGKNLRNYLE